MFLLFLLVTKNSVSTLYIYIMLGLFLIDGTVRIINSVAEQIELAEELRGA